MPKIYINRGEPYGFEEIDGEYLAALQAHPTPPTFYAESDPEVVAALMTRNRSEAHRRTVAFANSIRERIAASKHYLQAARWPIQLAAAQAIKAGNGSDFDVSIMAREARLRGLGETVEQLADKVLANSLIFASVGAAVDGIERATLDAIAAYAGTDPAHFETILANAKAVGRAEFMDIFTPIYGAEAAQARADVFFGS